MNIFGLNLTRKKASSSPAWLVRWMQYLLQGYDSNTQTYIDEGYQGNAVVYAIIKQCIDKYTAIPRLVYKKKNGQKLKQYSALTSSYTDSSLMQSRILKAQALDEVWDSDPLQMLIDDYVKGACGNAFGFKMITGTRVLYINKGMSRMGKPLSIVALPPQWFNIVPNQSCTAIDFYELAPEGVKLETFDANENLIIWDAYFNPDWDRTGQHLRGQSPLMAALNDMRAHNYGKDQQAFMYKNGGARGVMVPDGEETARILSGNPAAPGQLREQLDALVNGVDNKSKINALSYAMRHESFGMSSTDLQLIEGLRLTKEDICAVFNFPPELLTGDKKFDNYDAAIKYVVTNTIMGDLVAERNFLNQMVANEYGDQYYIDFDITALPELQQDMGKLTESLAKMDYLTYDEKREVMKYDSMGGAYATAYISSSLTPIELAGEADAFIDPAIEQE